MIKAENMKIEYAKRDDIYDIAAFLNECWRTEYRNIISDDYLDTMTVEKRHNGLLAAFDEGRSDFLIARDEGRIIGVAVFGKSLTEGYGDDGEISAIYMREDYIGKGFGHKLFTRVEQALAAKGYSHFVVDLLAGNTRAYEFYLAHGYEVVADNTIKLGEANYALYVMRKKNPVAGKHDKSGTTNVS